jgi:hypothetical protein
VKLLHVATLLLFVAALLGLVPGPLGTIGAVGAVTVTIATPVLRVAWLAVRWVRRGDIRYAACAAGLVLVVLSGSVIALATA